MIRKNINTETIEGRIYQHNLTEKKVENASSPNYGKIFINGSIDVATDEACLNVLNVHYTYVAATTKAGAQNRTYTTLKKIIESGKTILNDGKDAATKVRLTPSAAVNDFYPNGGDELVTTPRNEGGYVTIINELAPEGINRQKFKFDMLITNVNHIDANEERGIKNDYTQISGAIFSFKNDLIPFTVTAHNPSAMQYFEGLGASNAEPVYTQLWGKIENRTETKTQTVTSAFAGEDSELVDESERKVKEWVVTGANPENYDFGDENVMTVADLQKAIEDRNVYLAEVKRRSDEYYASRGNAVATPAPANNIPEGGFKF